METLEATFRIVTPMFIGGAHQTPEDGVRPPSVKGALRFWWRALNWTSFRQEKASDTAALKAMHDKESWLFGRAGRVDEGEQMGGQGVFLLRVLHQPNFDREASWPCDGSGATTGSGYMAFGILSSGTKKENAQRHRIGIQQKQEFTLVARFRPRTKSDDIAMIDDAIRAWGLFGGLGSRSRRGMGSVTLLSLNKDNCLLTKLQYQQAAMRLLALGANNNGLPPFTAISSQARFALISEGGDARKVHEDAGKKYLNHRGKPSQLRVRQKVGFGLPLQGVTQCERRASPLFFHIQELVAEKYVGGCLYLPAVFHPKHRSVDFKPVSGFVEGAALRS